MKDKTKDISVVQFCGLKYKTFSLIKEDDKENKRVKKVTKMLSEKES